MRATYPSDITRKQFEIIRPTLETARKATHPHTIDLYDIFCAILYRKREGCRWRSLPMIFPNGKSATALQRLENSTGRQRKCS
ncbi:MAG: transposase [Nitrososphaerota archaeon]|nr:transposase [Nitrososphaerota archaeon]